MALAYGWTIDADPCRCRVCGWGLGERGWTPAPAYLICSACGAESGVDDIDERSAGRYLAQWVTRGAMWFEPSAQPQDWSVATHLAAFGLVVRRRDFH